MNTKFWSKSNADKRNKMKDHFVGSGIIFKAILQCQYLIMKFLITRIYFSV